MKKILFLLVLAALAFVYACNSHDDINGSNQPAPNTDQPPPAVIKDSVDVKPVN